MVDYLSTTSLLLDIYYNEEKLGSATGFVIAKEEQFYLATNWHVVMGKHPDTGEVLSKTGAIPNALEIWHYQKSTSSNMLEWVPVRIKLYEEDKKCKKWLEHPSGHKVDVVLLPIEKVDQIQLNKFDLELAKTEMIPIPAMPVSIIGFPFGKTAGGSLPYWITGFIGSEPYVDIDEKPVFCVNASGRPGLSGSPVILRLNGGFYTNDGKFFLSGGYQTKFMGIYSGRVCDDSDLCRVWKPIVFDEILK